MDYLDYGSFAEDHGTGFEDLDIEQFLEESQRHSQELLENELESIEEELEERSRIHNEAMQELESKLNWYLERLEKAYNTVTGANNDVDELKTKVEHFYTEIRQEKRKHWLDRQELEQERRQITRELEETQDSERLLDELL